MSETSAKSLKVSRAGIVLIKSFEGFRPRAIRRDDGGWIIGYGHTLSAREGGSVSETDAELLLRYDLLPVEKTVNWAAPTDLNQHQFDALVSFAHSVGIERFSGSDVLERLSAGAAGAAADAMMGWPEPTLPETALRRRAAERALFVADPALPVALADLLVAPLPPPAVSEPLAQPEPTASATAETSAPEVTAATATEDLRGFALASLLGEPHPSALEPATVVPAFTTMPTSQPVLADRRETESPARTDTPEDTAPGPDGAPEVDKPALVVDVTAASPGLVIAEAAPDDTAPTESDVVDELRPVAAAGISPRPEPLTPIAMTVQRYAPYATAIIGPLPYLQPASPAVPPVGEPIAPALVEDAIRPEAAAPPTELAPVMMEPQPQPAAELVLTAPDDAPDDAPDPMLSRPLWSPEQRGEPDAFQTESGLFGEDLALIQGGRPILRHELEPEAPARFDWSQTGAFIFMGGVGLASFGASMAAFRLASEQDGGTEMTIIGWVLALIGFTLVGVSSINLYRRFGLPGGD